MTELKNSKKTYLGKTPDGRDRFALDVVAGDPTLEVQVGASTDDAYQAESGGGMSLTGIIIVTRSHTEVTSRVWGGYRFVSEEFPVAETIIDVAYLRGYVYSASYDDANFNIHFEELAAPATFAVAVFNITGRDRTEASVEWIEDGIAAGGVGWYNSPSLCGVGSPAQELFDAHSPTAIVVITRPNQDADKVFRTFSWDYSGNVSGAILHLEWTVAPTQQAVGAGAIAIAGTLTSIYRQFTSVGSGAIAIAGTLNRKTSTAMGAGSIAISGALSSVLTHFLNVGSGAVAIAGALSSVLTHFLSVGAGSITIAGTLGRFIKTAVGSASMTITGALGRKTAISIGAGAVSIAGTIGLKIKLAMGGGAISIASTLGRWIAISLAGSITPTGSLSSIKKMFVSVGNGAVTITNWLGANRIKYYVKKYMASSRFGRLTPRQRR